MPIKTSDQPNLALLKMLVKALDEKKAEDLRVLDVSAQSTITDYLLLATGNSEPHLRALRIEVERVLDAVRAPIGGMDGGGYGSGWTVIDAFQIMVHLFTPEQRALYALENLWKDAVPLNVNTLLAIPKPAPVKKAVRAKPAKRRVASGKATAKKSPNKKRK